MQDFATGKAVFVKALNQLTCFFEKNRKALRIMKLTGILLMAACLQVSAKGMSQTVTISVKDAPLITVLMEIKKQTGYSFFADSKELQKAKKVSISVNSIPLQQVLDQCFKDQPVTYQIVEKVINIIPREDLQTGIGSNGPPPVDIRGRVVNENGDPMLASISVKGTTIGTNTNDNGEFILNDVPDNAIIVITGVGIETKEITLSGKKDLLVMVRVAIKPLEETVIKGYYITTRKMNTGNVVSVKGSDIQKQPITDPIMALQGLVPGLDIRVNSGYPGSGLNKIEIRGRNSILGGQVPLVIIDGVPMPTRSLANSANLLGAAGALSVFNGLNFDNIESIEVLKDADATAIYGTRGANGIILITTKKGKAGKARVNLNFYQAQGEITRYPKLMNTREYLQMRKEAFNNDGRTPQPWDYDVNGTWDTTKSIDWENVLIGGKAKTTNFNFSVSGGNQNTQFLLSGMYNRQTTVLPGSFYDEIGSGHISINHKSSDGKFRLTFSNDYSSDHNVMPASDISSSVYFLAPNAPELYLPDGQLNWANYTWDNPLASLKQLSDANQNRFISSLNISYEVLSGLVLRSLLGYNDIRLNTYSLYPLVSWNPSWATANDRSSSYGTAISKTWIVEPQIQYAKNWGKHTFELLAGSTFQNLQTNASKVSGNGFTSDELLKNIGLASTKNINFINFTEYKLNKVYGRIGYNYAEKYLINLTGSREGSSRFGKNNQFGNFGALGIGYIFSKENLIMQKLRFLSFGKIRGSYGVTGNDQIDDYKYLDTYSGNSLTYQGISGLIPTGLPNPNYSWEKVNKLEGGLELGFLRDRIFLSASYFQNKTANQLVGYVIPLMTGFSSVTANFPAIVKNSGFEFVLNSVNISSKDLQWETNINLTLPKNKLVNFPNIESSSYNRSYSVGKSLAVRYVLHYTGLDKQQGIYNFQDLNNDGLISYPLDYDFLVDVRQKYYGGIRNLIRYKNFQLDFLFQFVKKNGPDYFRDLGLPGAFGANQPEGLLNESWKKAGDDNGVQKFTQNYGSVAARAYSNLRSSDAIIKDASFIRLRNLSLSYSFKTKLFSNLRLYVEGQNLILITKYKGADPETTSLTSLPPLRTVAAGLQIGL